jgi:NADH-quinone oxidoreductase subunit N
MVLIGAIVGEKARDLIQLIAAMLIGGVLIMVLSQQGGRVETFEGAFVSDSFTRFMKVLALIGSLAALGLSLDWMRAMKAERFEYPVLVVLATLGMMLMISANDLIGLYLGLELQSLSLYVLAAIRRDDVRSTEAGLKYFVLGALSSGMLLYGASLVYGFGGTVNFAGIAALVKGGASIGMIVGLVFMIAGLAFKISAVPFHMWTPDVYEGSPTPVATFFAAAPKVAAMALITRVTVGAFSGLVGQWQQVIVFMAIASMLLGAFAAIGQSNLKRLLAYSSIGHMGYALVGLAAGTQEGVQGVAVYMALYLAMTLGAFACILAMRRQGTYVEQIDDLSGLAKTQPAFAFALAVILFSLAGIPPLAGFFSKFYVFAAAIKAGLFGLSIIGVLASVVGAYYYLRIVKVMYFDEARPAFDAAPAIVTGVVALSAAVNLFFWVVAGTLVAATAVAARAFF